MGHVGGRAWDRGREDKCYFGLDESPVSTIYTNAIYIMPAYIALLLSSSIFFGVDESFSLDFPSYVLRNI